MRMHRVLFVLALSACGGAAESGREDGVAAGNGGEVTEGAGGVTSTDGDAMACVEDDDCMVGTPRDCCASSGPGCAMAWSRSAWEAYRAECAAVECVAYASMECAPREGAGEGEPVAACLEGRCVISQRSRP